MPVWLQITLAAVAPILAIIGATAVVMRALGSLDKRLQNIDLRIATIEFQIKALLTAFPQLISSLITSKVVTIEQGTAMISRALDAPPIAEFLRQIKPTVNPLSQADITRLQNYVQRMKAGQALLGEEAKDFYRISDIVTREYPNTIGSWLLLLIAGILIGAMLKGE